MLVPTNLKTSIIKLNSQIYTRNIQQIIVCIEGKQLSSTYIIDNLTTLIKLESITDRSVKFD